MLRFSAFLLGLLGLTIITSPRLAWAQTEPQDAPRFEIVDGVLFFIEGDKKEEIALPGPALAVKHMNQTLYVAMGDKGAAVFDTSQEGSPTMNRVIPVSHGQVTGFLELEGELWMQVDATTAVRLTPSDAKGATIAPLVAPTPSTAATQAAPPPREAPEEVEAPDTLDISEPIRILKIYPGEVELNVGAVNGVKSGDRFSVYRTQPKKHHGKVFTGEELVAVLEIRTASESVSVARIWKGDRVQKDDRVTPAEKHHDVSMVYPRHLDHTGELSIVLRPLIAVSETGGFGMLNEATASYWMKWVFFDVVVAPLGLAWTDDGNVVSTSIRAHLGFNSRPFSIGMGAGVAITPTDMSGAFIENEKLGNQGSEETEGPWSNFTRARFALAQKVRLGARDGLCFTINNLLLWVSADETKDNPNDDPDEEEEEAPSGFVYGGTTGRVDIPIAARVNLFLEGGGGVMGYGFGALGVFAWVRGNGDNGSIGLSTSAGFAMVWGTRERSVTEGTDTRTETDSVTVGGPMISLGFTYRFGF
ncbi:MAG: hypothetical protein GY854_09825 [Deltaproteobacteria bacterium]|nr:hypothetical protein [Deltaproteobacteria bacterium]